MRVCVFRLGVALCAAASAAGGASAQDDHAGRCPLALTAEEAALVAEREALGVYDLPAAGRGSPVVIPVTAHIVRRSNGTGGLSEADLTASIDQAGAHLAHGLIELCLVETRFIDSDFFFSGIQTFADIDQLRSTDPSTGTLNIYFTPTLGSEIGSLCGISSFTFSPVQGIAMDNGCTAQAGNMSTLAHEIGHYLDLFHTHESTMGIECVDGTNCGVAGDMICDTPADPNVLGEVNAACLWTSSEMDVCGSGQVYTPSTRNLMSYSTKACRDEFTAGQLARARATLLTLRPELALTACVPVCTNPADVNGDNAVTPADFSAWVTAYNAGSVGCDQNADGLCLPADFSSWVANFNLGCP